MRLAELQRRLQRHILSGDGAIEKDIAERAPVPVATRLGIYSEAYRLRLVEALAGNYPAMAKLLGVEFAALGRAYIDRHPSQHRSVRWFGHRMEEFLGATRSDQPWLVDLARWEWAVAHAFDAAAAPILTQQHLTTIEPTLWPTLRFVVHPSVTQIRVRSNIVETIQSSANEQPLPSPTLAAPTQWCIWREALTVRYRSLDAIEAASFDAIWRGSTFGELCELLTTWHRSDAVPLHAAGFLKRWVEEQWLSELKLG